MKQILFALTFSFFAFGTMAQDITSGQWLNEDKDARIQFYEQNGKLYGKIVWLKTPKENGKDRTDIHNPKAELKTRPLMGLVFLKGFVKENEKAWKDGEIYDPKSGKTYSSNIKMASPNQLNIRGYIGVSLIGRTTKFTKVD